MPATVGGSVGLGRLPARLPGPPLSTWGREVSEQVPASPPCSPASSTLSEAHVSACVPTRPPLQTQTQAAASRLGLPVLPLPFRLLFLPPLDLPGVPTAPWASTCAAASAGQRWWLWPGPEPVPLPPTLGRAHLCLVSLEGSGEAGQAGGSESPWGLQLLYLQALGLFTAWAAPVLPAPHPSRALQPGTGLPQGLAGTWHIHARQGRLTVSSAGLPEPRVGVGGADSPGGQGSFCLLIRSHPARWPYRVRGICWAGRGLAGPARVTQGVQAGQHI